MERRGANSPLLIVCSLLSYSDSRLRFCRSWKVLTLKQLILLAFSSLKHRDEPFSICYLSAAVLLIWLYYLCALHKQDLNTYPVNEIIYFCKMQQNHYSSPLSSPSHYFFPIASPTLSTVMIIFFLAMTHKSENCGFIYFHFLFWSKRGISTVGRECNILL